ncbi:MAG TPA: alpha/beta fold hydrolase [Vicinamibacterales bacterium]|nr:alpha/beta fold hydrolase [Vicinamibacterales bacterium]
MSFTSTSGRPRVHPSGQPHWLVVSEPKPAACLRLVCFPHAGGAASAYFPWARALAGYPIEVAAAHLPGRDARITEPPPSDLDAVIDALAGAIEALTARPFALFGHSMGARLAFEVARRLRERGAAGPAWLFVSGAPAPQLQRVDQALRSIEDDTAFLAAVAGTYGGVPRIVLEGDHFYLNRARDALLADLVARLRPLL